MVTASAPLANRITNLRDEVMARKGSFPDAMNPFTRDVALWRASVPGRSRIQQRAALLYELVALAPIGLREEWRIVGDHMVTDQVPHFGFLSESASDAPIYLETLGVPADSHEAVQKCVLEWHAAFRGEALFADVGEDAAEANRGRIPGPNGYEQVFIGGGWVENHSIRDFAKVLRVGFRGIRQEVEKRLASMSIADPEYPRCESFWHAALRICDAGILLGQRHAEAAREAAAKAQTTEEQARLTSIAEICDRVPAEGARTLYEAIQALWFAHVLTCGEDGINANSIGRLDQILFPYYQADFHEGRITRNEALELMEELACKLYLDYDVQAITLGGTDAEGKDAVNDLSFLILEATRNVNVIRDISVRWHPDIDPEFIAYASELIAEGGGIPFLFNDACFVPALTERGIAVEDARNYAPIGCIELTIPGRANPHAVSGWFNAAKCLELALFDGCDARSGASIGPRTGLLTDHKTFDDLFAAYCRQVEFFTSRMVYYCNRGELLQRERGPLPCWSVLTDACIERGRDITDCGAVYNYHSVCFLGTANVADSLAAVRKLIYEEQAITPDTLLDALRVDFNGFETLRTQLLRKAPKYGNDDPYVDEFARQIAEHFITIMDTMHSPLGGRYMVHLFSFLINIPFGKAVAATPDGRKAGEPLAYSLSAHQGRDERGVTAMLQSLARMPHDQAAGASAAIIEIDPALAAGPAGVQRLTQLINGAFQMGVGQLQWNVTTVERLLQAQNDPERYGNIPVRVAGFSQQFRLIDRELQDHIIARTKHRQ